MNLALRISIFVLIFFFSLGQIGRIGLGDYPIFIHLYEMPLAVFTILAMFAYRLTFLKNPRLRMVHIIVVWTIMSFAFSSFFYSWYENGIALLYLLRLGMHILFGFYFWEYLSHESVLFKNRLSIAISLLIVWFTGTMLVQYVLYPNIGNIAYLGWDPHNERAVGLFLEPPLAAAFLVLSMIYLFQSKLSIIYRFLSIGILGILLLLTYSRGALVAALVTLGYILIKKMKFKQMGIIIMSALLIFVFWGKTNSESTNLFRTTSIQSRMTDYQQGVDIWSQNIISGIGYNHIRFEKEKYIDEVFVEDYNPSHGIASFHSSFLMIGVTTGVVGLVMACIILLQLSKVSVFSHLSLIFLSIISLFDNILLHPFVIVLFVFYYSLSSRTCFGILKDAEINSA
ncbi:MAG: O-antigen ligase family protein [bacterium]|nr:O-antigen ligase family protein [bacterium]